MSTRVSSFCRGLPGGVLLLVLLAAAPVRAAWQQISPTGYTGAINTPTADVLPAGTLAASYSNTIPEWSNRWPGVGAFGGLNFGFGLLPGVEAIGRLTFNGDIHCDSYRPGCRSTTRDLSVGFKAQLPIHWLLPEESLLKPRFAVGLSDYGGAATNFRQVFGVASLAGGPVDLSLGYARKTGGFEGGLMDGFFGSANLQLTRELAAVLEHDTRETRLGLAYRYAISPQWEVLLAASQKLTDETGQRRIQTSVGLVYSIDRHRQIRGLAPAELTELLSRAEIGQVRLNASTVAARPSDLAIRLVRSLKAYGFTDISLTKTSRGWAIQAEPTSWRQNRMDAAGALLAATYLTGFPMDDELVMRLSFRENVVFGLRTSARCMEAFAEGRDRCGSRPSLELNGHAGRFEQEGEPEQSLVQRSESSRYWPQFEISPAMSYTAGTEFGLFDYSLGVTLGWEVPLYRGLSWQGYRNWLLSESEDFTNPRSYFRRVGLGEDTRWGANLLTYQHRFWSSTWLQGSVGYLGPRTRGQQIDAAWLSPSGRFRLSLTKGAWERRGAALDPQIAAFRVAMIPGRWNLEVAGGEFLNNDPGWRVESMHQFGSNRIRFYYRETGPGNNATPYKRKFAGFSINVPIGPAEATRVGNATVRGRDQWPVGLETKVGEADNYIELGYGLFPVVRHALISDVLDYDRGGEIALEANRYRIRAMFLERLQEKRNLP